MPATLTEPARPLALVRAIARAREIALADHSPLAGANWRDIATAQATLATEALECLAALVEALDPHTR